MLSLLMQPALKDPMVIWLIKSVTVISMLMRIKNRGPKK